MSERRLVKRLAQSLQQDILPGLSDHQLEIVLGWLAGSQSAPSRQMEEVMGQAGQDPELTRLVFAQADAILFRDGYLCLNSAGLAAMRDSSQARRRFRLLLSAFHPDRMQWHTDWLTPRFQAINHAYRDFKHSPAPTSTALQPAAPGPGSTKTPPPQYRGISPESQRQPARWRLWVQDRWLGPKLVAVLSLIVVLPLLSWSLDTIWLSDLRDSRRAADRGHSVQPIADSELGTGPDLAVPILTGRVPEAAPTVDSLLERWSLVLAAESGDTVGAETSPGSKTISYPDVNVLQQTRAEAPNRITDTEIKPGHVHTCTPGDPASHFGGWLANEQHWARAESPLTARSSRVSAGVIDGHALADSLENYRRSVEAGNLAQLVRNYVEMPRANMQQGERWLMETYGALFEHSIIRTLSIDVIEAYRRGEGWNVVTRYRLGVRLANCSDDHMFEHDLHFFLVQDPLLFRVAAVDY